MSTFSNTVCYRIVSVQCYVHIILVNNILVRHDARVKSLASFNCENTNNCIILHLYTQKQPRITFLYRLTENVYDLASPVMYVIMCIKLFEISDFDKFKMIKLFINDFFLIIIVPSEDSTVKILRDMSE